MIDCVLVGHNEIDFATVLGRMERMQVSSGAYRNLLGNTVLLRGRRHTYMDLLNQALRDATGTSPGLDVASLPSLGICTLKSFLARRGFEVEIVNFYNAGKERLAELLARGARSVAIVTTYYVDHEPIAEIVRFVRERCPETRLIVGGPHILDICSRDIATQDYLLHAIGADFYVHDSQGEDTLGKLLQAIRTGGDVHAIPNLVFPEGPRPGVVLGMSSGTAQAVAMRRTPRTVENNSLDADPVDWSLFQADFYTPTAPMRTARSCPFSCTFCKYPIVAGTPTYTSLEVIEQEMRQLAEAGVHNLVFVDDTFNVPVQRFKKILRMMIANKFDFDWFSFFRCNNCDDEGFDLMQESGCKGVFLGIESGDQGVLGIMNKVARVEQYEQGIRRLTEHDIFTFASFIIGFPGETAATVANTIAFIEATRPTFYRAEIYYHDPQVPIGERSAAFGLKGGGYSWRHHTMDWRMACDMVDRIYASVRASIVFPLYMFDFWSIPYLLGRGIALEDLIAFMRISQRLLLNGAGNGGVQDDPERIYTELVDLGRKIGPIAG